jgi:hypothetical protein
MAVDWTVYSVRPRILYSLDVVLTLLYHVQSLFTTVPVVITVLSVFLFTHTVFDANLSSAEGIEVNKNLVSAWHVLATG